MPEDRTQSLRIELKTWEKEFTATNGGKRPGREDIKNNAEIAAKYREYDKLRRPSTKQSEPLPTATQHATPKKAVFAATPQKPTSHFLLPNLQLQPQPDEDEEPEPTPAAIRMHLGPTPQRDGQLLSLFDDLPSTTTKPSRAALKSIGANATNFTPSKPSQPIFTSPLENPYNRTPASSSKRFLLDSYISTTPLKRKRDDQDADAHATPSSSAKGLSTPAFLRRSSNKLIMDTLVEEAENDDHAIKSLNLRGRITQPPFKKRGMVRSLSSLIQGLRQQEDDQLDEQLEMMREMEVGVPTQQQSSVQVQDSQVVMPLGPDRGFESEESEEDAQQQTGIFRKPWKKKGLKRQTKRVIMRPAPKPKAPPVQQDQASETDQDSIAETQLQHAPVDNDDDDDVSDADSDTAYSDTEAKRKRQLTKPATTMHDDDATTLTSKDSKSARVVKKAARKIKATAHANFRKLNIKNQNSKAKGGNRFRRK